MIFKVTNKDNKGNSIFLQGAVSKNSNIDVARLVIQNYDDDTQTIYNIAGISARDAFGTSNSNGIGDLLFLTNVDGGSNITEKMRLKYNGQLCLGNNIPISSSSIDALLSVYGGVSISNNLHVFNQSTFCNDVNILANLSVNSSVAISSNVIVGNDINSFGNINVHKSLIVSNDLFVNSNAFLGRATITTNQSNTALFINQLGLGHSMHILRSNTSKFIVSSNGNIGINNSTPLYALDVDGECRITGEDQVGGIIKVVPSSSSYAATIGFYTNSNLLDDYWSIGQNALQVGVGNFGIGTSNTGHLMTISNNGFVGIGKSNPTRRLDVNGDINFEGMIYQNNVAFPREPLIQTFNKINTNKKDYTVLLSWINDLSFSNIRNLKSVSTKSYLVPSYKDDTLNSNFNYSLRVYDLTNNRVLAEESFSNQTPLLVNLTLSNLSPNTITELELQGKVGVVGSNLCVENLLLKYN